MTGDEMSGLNFTEIWADFRANWFCDGTSRAEPAARGRINRGGHVSL